MIYLLDTNIASYLVKDRSPRAARRLQHASVEHDVCISVLTEAEMRFGLAQGRLVAAVADTVELFLSKIDILLWDSACARAYAQARATLECRGRPLANMDLLIAAHAAAVGAVLVTNDRTLLACAKPIGVRQAVNWADDVGGKP